MALSRSVLKPRLTQSCTTFRKKRSLRMFPSFWKLTRSSATTPNLVGSQRPERRWSAWLGKVSLELFLGANLRAFCHWTLTRRRRSSLRRRISPLNLTRTKRLVATSLPCAVLQWVMRPLAMYLGFFCGTFIGMLSPWSFSLCKYCMAMFFHITFVPECRAG